MVKLLALFLLMVSGFYSFAQKKCVTMEYTAQELDQNNSLRERINDIERFTGERSFSNSQRVSSLPETIKIPVVVHVLYHFPAENVSKQIIDRLVAALNRDFNKKNPDTINTPAHFKPPIPVVLEQQVL
jgi:hypothetical protein